MLVLVLLLVGTVIAFSLYTRSVREAERVAQEKASSEANELTETAIGLISMSNYSNLSSPGALDSLGCSEGNLATDVGCRSERLSLPEAQTFFESIVEGDLDIDLSDFDREIDGYCTTEFMLRYGNESDRILIEKDSVYSLFFSGASFPPCVANFYLNSTQASPPSGSGFIMEASYKTNDVLKEYHPSDIVGFRYEDGGSRWQSYTAGSALTFSAGSIYRGVKDGHSLHEVRFTAVGGSSFLKWEFSDCASDEYMIVEVGATCKDRYVGKRFTVPSEPYAPPIFDYVFFNNEGDFRPEKLQFGGVGL